MVIHPWQAKFDWNWSTKANPGMDAASKLWLIEDFQFIADKCFLRSCCKKPSTTDIGQVNDHGLEKKQKSTLNTGTAIGDADSTIWAKNTKESYQAQYVV